MHPVSVELSDVYKHLKYKINSLVGSREGTPSTWLIESFLRFTDVRQSDSFAFYLMKEIH